jgi:hypothetical protein
MEKNIHRKALTVSIICLFLLMSVPVISSSEMPVINEKSELLNKGGLIDNVPITCRGIYLEQILEAILWIPVFYIHFMYENNNDIPISINQHVTVTGRDGQILYDYDHNYPFKLNAHWSGDSQFMRRIELKNIGYMFGPIDITFYFKIPDDNSSVTLLFHGFIFNIGAVIFNRNGEKIEST